MLGLVNRLGFKSALLTVVCLLMLLLLVITTVVSNKILKATASKDLKAAILSSATYESFRIAEHIEKSAQAVEGLAKLYGEYSSDVAPEKLMGLSAAVSGVHKVTAGFDDGRSYASKHDVNFPGGVGDITKYDPRARPWFKQGRAANGLMLSDVFFTTRGQQPMLGAMHPVEGGVILVDIRLNHLHGVLEAVDVVDGAVGIITDGQGLILASTAEFAPVRGRFDALPATTHIANHVFENDYTFHTITIGGEESVFVSKKIHLVSGASWYLMIAVEHDIAFAPVNAAAWKLNVLALLIAVISIFVLLLVLNRLYKPVLELKATVEKLSDGEGDLTSRLMVKSDDDLGSIARGINVFIESLQLMMVEVKSMTMKLSEGVEALRGQGEQSSRILIDHLAETNQVALAMEGLSSSAKLVSDSAGNALSIAAEADAVADASKGTIVSAQKSLQTLVDDVEQATENVTKMSKETQDIASILSVIGGIAEQTNLLALNAAIEAARAGEQGRGFAVVADEVRALAGKTQQSTREIEAALDSLQDGASSVVEAIERTGQTSENAVSDARAVAENLGGMTNYVTQVNQLSVDISKSANEQSAVIQELNQNMSRIQSMVDGLNTKGQSMREETENIEVINANLVSIVSKFKLQ